MNKIVFIINTLPNQRCIKRIDEFIENGYEVNAYSFIREGLPFKQPNNFNIEIIGKFKKSGGYKRRIIVIVKALNLLKSKYRNDPNLLYYYFGLDIALFATLFIKGKYFYEVSDLSQTYIGNFYLTQVLNWIDKKIIKNSLETVLTSEGFLIYYYGVGPFPDNVSIIPNRVNKESLVLDRMIDYNINIDNLKIGFVGLIRYKSIFNFAKCVAEYFPQHEFHFYGKPIDNKLDLKALKNRSNVFFHGEFQNPRDLPLIYNSIDIVLSTYDTNIDNVKYAEPNKIYEAIFFQTPIIVSKGTFLSEKVEKLGIGYSIDAMNMNEVVEFINDLSEESIAFRINQCRKYPPSFSVDSNDDFFNKISSKISQNVKDE